MDFGTDRARAPADLAWLRGIDAYTMGAYVQAEEEFKAAVGMDPGHGRRLARAARAARRHRDRAAADVPAPGPLRRAARRRTAAP